jgi:CRISPR-associated protein Csd2
MTSNNIIKNRYEFVYLFDVKDGNPNGDPDAGNFPRTDPETGHGLVTDVCLKRKIRDIVPLMKAGGGDTVPAGYDIYIRHHSRGGLPLNTQHKKAYDALGIDPKKEKKGEKRDAIAKTRKWMCDNFYDIRTFGAVMGTEINCGQVRGPVQINFARSIDPILSMEHCITRVAFTQEEKAETTEGVSEMGRKNTVPYALYRAHGFISPNLAADTGFTEDDLTLLWDALSNMFDHDHSASRGEMHARKLIIFKHESALGNAPSHKLFDSVQVKRRDATKPPRAFEDYQVTIDKGSVPSGVTIDERL